MSEQDNLNISDDVEQVLTSESGVVQDVVDFEKYGEIIPGLEHLGRAITDDAGVPSGSPANYENLRGKGPPSISTEERARILADLAAEFPKEA